MTRSWLNPVVAFLSLTYGLAASVALAAPHGGFSGGNSRQGSGMRQTAVNNRVSGNLSPVKVGRPGGGITVKPTGPKFPGRPAGPVGPIVGPFKPPVGPIGPIGPVKPPKGPIVGPIKPPLGPIGPIGPVKPPKGPIVGPIKPPIGPIGPIGPIKPPGGGGGGGGGGNGGGHGGGHGGKHKHCWPTIVLGCHPCGGHYCPPVYTQPVYVPVPAPVIVAAPAPAAETTVIVNEAPATTSVEAAAAPAEKLPQVPVGSTLALQAKELGTTTGQVLLVIDKLTLGVQIDEWTTEHTIATLPKLGITSPTKAELVVVKADGTAASSVKVELVAAQAEGATGLAAVAAAR